MSEKTIGSLVEPVEYQVWVKVEPWTIKECSCCDASDYYDDQEAEIDCINGCSCGSCCNECCKDAECRGECHPWPTCGEWEEDATCSGSFETLEEALDYIKEMDEDEFDRVELWEAKHVPLNIKKSETIIVIG